MQEHFICHCGKCTIKCNKHNKRAKCRDCKKVRMLGTVVKKGVMRHVCDECGKRLGEQIVEEENKRAVEANKSFVEESRAEARRLSLFQGHIDDPIGPRSPECAMISTGVLAQRVRERIFNSPTFNDNPVNHNREKIVYKRFKIN